MLALKETKRPPKARTSVAYRGEEMMTPSDRRCVLRLAGPVVLRRPDGAEVPLRSAKQVGLLALLGTGRELRRTRAELQDKLWSRSDPERGAASLRQALSGLRRQLGDDADLIIASTRTVALDPDRVTVSLELPAAALTGRAEFAEGLEIEDPEFEDWLRDRRSEFGEFLGGGTPVAPTGDERPTMVALPPSCAEPRLRPFAEILTSDIAAQIARGGDADLHTGGCSPTGRDLLSVQTRAVLQGDRARTQVELCAPRSRRILWIGSVDYTDLETGPDAGELEMLTVEATGAAIRYFGRLCPHGLPCLSHLPYQLRAQFPFHAEHYDARIDDWLSRNFDPRTKAVRLAWQARLRLLQLLDGSVTDPSLPAEVRALGTEALSLDPANPMVAAIAADVALHAGGEPQVAVELARASTSSDPLNPIAQAILAQGLLRLGENEGGRRAARRALSLSITYPDRSWWHAICTAAEKERGDTARARLSADVANSRSPASDRRLPGLPPSGRKSSSGAPSSSASRRQGGRLSVPKAT